MAVGNNLSPGCESSNENRSSIWFTSTNCGSKSHRRA
jgi:hypothetical protein